MQEPGSPLVPLDPTKFREMVEKQHVNTQQQQTQQSSTTIPQQHQYYRGNLTRTQSTSSVGSSESVASVPPPTDLVGGHFQQQMSPQYSPHVGGQQQRFWYPHSHVSPRTPYCAPLPHPQTGSSQTPVQQPMTPQPVRTPQSSGSASSPRMAMPSSHTPVSQVVSPEMAQSSPGSGRSPMGSPIQSQIQPSPAPHQQTRMRAAVPQQYQQPQAYPPNFQQPVPYSPNYPMMQTAAGGTQPYPRPYGTPLRQGVIIAQQQPQQVQMQQQMGVNRPVMVRQPHQYIQRSPSIPINRPQTGQPGMYQDTATFRSPHPGQPFVQYGPNQAYPQQHPLTIQHMNQYGKPGPFPQAGQPYISSDNLPSPASGQFGSVPPSPQQRYPPTMQPSPSGILSPPMAQKIAASSVVPAICNYPTNQQYYRPTQQQQYISGGVAAASPQQSTGSASVTPTGSTSQLHSPVMIHQQQQYAQQQQAIRYDQLHQQQSVALYSPQMQSYQQQQIGMNSPVAAGMPSQLHGPQQHPVDMNQQIRQPVMYGGMAMQQQVAQQQFQPRMVQHVSGQITPQQQEMKIQFFGHEPHVMVPAEMCLVGGVFLIVDYDRILDQKEVSDWRLVISLHGGEVETSYSGKCTVIICESLRHPVVQQALKEGKRCVTAQWLNDCLLQKRLQPPWKAVHFPSPYGDNKPCKNKIFTICGFDANERSCLKQMITAIGGKYVSYLTKHNHFVIAKCLEDNKVAKALEWKIPIVNVHFLTELFLGQGAVLQNMGNPKYHQFLPRELLQRQHPNAVDPFRIDPTMLPPLMSAWRVPIAFTSDCWKAALERKHKIESDDGKIFPHKKLKLSPAPEESEIENHRRSLVGRKISSPKICFTGLYPAEVDNLTRKALWLGADIVNDVEPCTHLVACDLKRTQKLLDGIALGKFVVTPLWIRQSYKQQQFVDAVEYLVKDEGNEKFFGFNLKLSIHRARQGKLFQNVIFYLTPSVQPSQSILREMIQTAGGSVLPQRPPGKKILELEQQGVHLVIITCENDLHLCQSLLDAGIPIHSAEFVLTGILRQEVDFTSYRLELRQNEGSAKGARDG